MGMLAFVGAIYTHFALLSLISSRIIASSNKTVFPLPVGAIEVKSLDYDARAYPIAKYVPLMTYRV